MEKLQLLENNKLEYGKVETENGIVLNYRKKLTFTETMTAMEELIQTIYQVEKNEDGTVIDYKVSITNDFIIEALKLAVLSKIYFKESLDFGEGSFIDVADKVKNLGLDYVLEVKTDYDKVNETVDKSIAEFKRFIKADIDQRFLYGITLLSNDFSDLLAKMVQMEDLKTIELNAKIDSMPKTKEEVEEFSRAMTDLIDLSKDK